MAFPVYTQRLFGATVSSGTPQTVGPAPTGKMWVVTSMVCVNTGSRGGYCLGYAPGPSYLWSHYLGDDIDDFTKVLHQALLPSETLTVEVDSAPSPVSVLVTGYEFFLP